MSEPAHRAYLSLGSNIDPERHLREAARLLSSSGSIAAVSQVWETAPVGFVNQPNFLNAAILIRTSRPAEEFCEAIIPRLETALGRVRDPENKNGPRTIDVDLSLFDDEVRQIGTHTIPDPAILRHPHVTVPLAELDPRKVHPIDGRTLAEIATALALGLAMHARPDVTLC